MSTTTKKENSTKEELTTKFTEVFGKSEIDERVIDSGIQDSDNVVAIIFNWDKWVDALNFSIERSEFSQTPTGLTSGSYGNNPTIFSDGEYPSHYTNEYLDKLKEFLGYDLRKNLEKISLMKQKNAPMLVEEGGFDIIIAPRLPPENI